MDIGVAPDRHSKASLPLAVGEVAGKAEMNVVHLATNRVYRFREQHPLLFGLIAFVIGSGLIGIFTMTTYANWRFEGINLKVAFYQVVFGSLGGGIAMVVLAFAYARTVRETIVPSR